MYSILRWNWWLERVCSFEYNLDPPTRAEHDQKTKITQTHTLSGGEEEVAGRLGEVRYPSLFPLPAFPLLHIHVWLTS